MFGIRFRPAAATVWHPSVEAYDVLGHDQLIGRIYPRHVSARGQVSALRHDFDAVSRDLYKKYVGGTSPDDLHPEASFDHSASAGYAGAYYTYQWSLAIAKDLFTQFDDSDLLNSKIGERYRETILNPGGSEPAAKLVEDFLGRPFNLKAYREWLQSD